MVIRTNIMALNAYRNLRANQSAMSKSLEKLASGFRINRAADDASGLAISEKMKAQIRGLEQASSNAQDGINLVQAAEGATQEIHNILNRMVELATKSANGTIQNEVDREAIQAEMDELSEEVTRIAKSTNFNGANLLDGSLSEGGKVAGKEGATGKPLKLQVGDTNDEYNMISVKVDNLSAGALGLEGLDVSNAESAGNAIDVIKDAINKVSSNRGRLGAMQNRLEYTVNNLETSIENLSAANSRIRDTDMAKEMMNYTKHNILAQVAMAMLAQANQRPYAILQLLG